jgi:hypothetical protein
MSNHKSQHFVDQDYWSFIHSWDLDIIVDHWVHSWEDIVQIRTGYQYLRSTVIRERGSSG